MLYFEKEGVKLLRGDCLNPKDKIGRLYKITNEGKVILNEI